MATEAQLLANQANAKLSTGPVSPEGKARASRNATTLGLFSASAFVRPEECEAYASFRAAWIARLVPKCPLEDALVTELVQAAWRLRRCALLETTAPDATEAEDLDRVQASIDRARTTAQRALQRNLNELRRVQTDRRMSRLLPYGAQAHAEFGVASIKDVEHFLQEISHNYPAAAVKVSPAAREWENSKRSQSASELSADSAERTQPGEQPTPRNASCPCGSGEKYKRCCGRNAPPVLSAAAA